MKSNCAKGERHTLSTVFHFLHDAISVVTPRYVCGHADVHAQSVLQKSLEVLDAIDVYAQRSLV